MCMKVIEDSSWKWKRIKILESHSSYHVGDTNRKSDRVSTNCRSICECIRLHLYVIRLIEYTEVVSMCPHGYPHSTAHKNTINCIHMNGWKNPIFTTIRTLSVVYTNDSQICGLIKKNKLIGWKYEVNKGFSTSLGIGVVVLL